MNPYRFTVSLRIKHPTIDPNIITKKLDMEPRYKWKAGDARKTPDGDPLKGNYESSYWTAPIHKEDNLYSEDISLEDYLEKKTTDLSVYADFFSELKSSDGSIEYFIGIFGDNNFGLEYPASLLKSIGELNINLALDIYPEKNST